MSTLGSPENPLSVAVVGSGPSGFYAAEALLKSDLSVNIHMLDRLPCPFGLVRSGVAPDHPKLKNAIGTYDKIATRPGFHFLGNVNVGTDISVADITSQHHATIFACGAETDRRLGISGEDLPGSHTATEFVGWYNGHPDYRDRQFDLSHEAAVIIGQGNVAADVSRILAKTVDELKNTDIAEHALDALAESRIRDIYVIGRRGPAQAKFTSKELKEFGALEDCDPIVRPEDLQLDPQSELELADKSNSGNARNVDLFRQYAERATGSKQRRCHFQFLAGPVSLQGESHLEAVILEKNRLEGEAFSQRALGTGEQEILECGILFRSIGYRGVAMPGLPFDDRGGVFSNQNGRIVDEQGQTVTGVYVAGWIKRGPTGIIGTNRADAVETVECLKADLANLDSSSKPNIATLRASIEQRGIKTVTFDAWKTIDAIEIKRGEAKQKPREKFTRVSEFLEQI